jgi:hypothetical protein
MACAPLLVTRHWLPAFFRRLQSVPFYRERSSTRTTLGSLLVVLLLR